MSSGTRPVCLRCEKTFSCLGNLTQHLKTHSDEKPFRCDVCPWAFVRNSALKRHKLTHQNKNSYTCVDCGQVFNREDFLNKHKCMKYIPIRRRGSTDIQNKRRKAQKDALGVFSTKLITPSEENKVDILLFLNQVRSVMEVYLLQELDEKRSLKWYAVLKVRLIRISREADDDECITPHFRSDCVIELLPHTVAENIEQAFEKMKKTFEDFTQHGSGWVLDEILHLEICCARYRPLAASSYIPLPRKIQNKKAVLNIKNLDNKCLTWCILAHKMNIDQLNHPEDVRHYIPYEQQIKLGNIQYPVSIKSIPTVENLNAIRINIYGYEEGEIFPLYVSSRTDEDMTNLLLIATENTQHFCLIRNMIRLLEDLEKYKQ